MADHGLHTTPPSSLNAARDAETLKEVSTFLRHRAQYLVEGFYPNWNHVKWLRKSAARLVEVAILREERDSLDREAARLVLLAIRRGDDFWREELQHAFDLTIAEAEELVA